LRQMRRAPSFAAVAVATLALGIGSSTAIFTIVNSVLLRPLSFPEPQRLAMIRPTSGSRLSPAYLHDWRLQSLATQDIAGWYDVRANLTGRGEPLDVQVDRVTSNFFALLGTRALLGHTFTTGSDLSRIEPEVLLSYAFWQRRFGAEPSVVGQPITLDGETLTIVGVMPERLGIRTTELAESRAELWTPFPLIPGNRTGMGGFLNVVARLATGATREQAQAELALIARRIEYAYPSYSQNWGVDAVPLHDATVKDVRLTLLVLFGAVGILLIVACANVANLVLGRTATRQAELAIRLSLGASAGRLVRQLLTESFVLAAVGGVFGVLLALWGTALLVSAVPAGLELPRTQEITVDLRVLVFSFLLTILTAVLFGLMPVLGLTRAPQLALREATRGSSSGLSFQRMGSFLIVSEVALSLILLAGAGLLGRSFWALSRVSPGFHAENVLTMRTTLPATKYDTDDSIRAFGRDLLERVKNLPEIRAVGSVNYLPMNHIGAAATFEIEGRPEARPGEQHTSWISVVGGSYFATMRIPLLRGRLPGDADTEKTEPVFVIDDELARRYWPNGNPIGARITWRVGEAERVLGEIVGVVGSVRWQGMSATPNPTTYFWFPQAPARQITVVANTVGDPIAMANLISAQVKSVDANQSVAEIRAMRDVVADDLARPRFTLVLLGSFAGAALLLAAIGLYGVIAFAAAQRTREIGVRIALGAKPSDVLRLFMRRGMLLTGTGLVIGIVTARASGRLVTGLLYGVTPTDPFTLLAVALFLAAVAMLATYLPARRATRVDPMVTLRAE
jgi:putative ABC transport system permease protein